MLTAYVETAVPLKSTSDERRVEITIPRQNGSYDRSRHSARSDRNDRLATDDKSYLAEYLSSASSVFFRPTSAYPRSFLWRLLSKDKILEISAADFAHPESEPQADRTIALEFQDPISPRGVSFCDAGNENGFFIFVLTNTNEVFEICLQTTYFQNARLVPQDLHTWCRPIPASSLSIDQAFHLHASSYRDVFVAFASGKIQHWRREDVQGSWTHMTYDDKRWGSSLLSLVSRKGVTDIDFNGMRLAANTSYAMTHNDKYLFTACLNHTLRIWHLQSGKLVDTRDLLDQARDINDRVQLNPANSGFMRFLEGTSKHEHILYTCSPLDGGQIKFWRVRNSFDDDPAQFSIEDMEPATSLRLPDPDPTGSSIWSISGLQIIFEKQSKQWQAWIVWRNHNHHKAYSLDFNFADISSRWKDDWVDVTSFSSKNQAPDFLHLDSEETTSKWLDFIFFPGRYSVAVLETALSQYVSAVHADASKYRSRPLVERLQSTIKLQVAPQKKNGADIDQSRLSIDTDQQWRHFWRIAETLNGSRFAPLSIDADALTGMVLLSMTDVCCAIRECSNLELLLKNTVEDLNDLQRISRSRWPYRKVPFTISDAKDLVVFLDASQRFLTSFPPELTSQFLDSLDEDLFLHSEIDTATRIVNIYNDIDFANAVPDDVEQEFYKSMSVMGGGEAISTKMYKTLFELLLENLSSRDRKSSRRKTDFGTQTTVLGVLEQILIARQVLRAMIATTVFVDENQDFDTAENFEQAVEALKTIERDLWIATHYRGALKAASPSRVSIMQDVIVSTFALPSFAHHPMPYVLTQHIRGSFVHMGAVEAYPADAIYLQCNMLRHGELDLATDFLKFLPLTPWATYVRGRLSLALSQYHEASMHFKQAAQKLASKKALGQMTTMSSGLLSAQEASHFNNGLASYYDHIASLFESQSAFSDVTTFLTLALESAEADKEEPVVNFRQGILSRLFLAQVKCSDFEKAYEALLQFTEPSLQRASTIELIDAMLESSSSLKNSTDVVRQIQAFPLKTNPQLALIIDQHLASLARKQTTIPSAGGLWISSSAIDYLSILHALRLSRKDYRGAASTLFERLRLTQKSGRARSDPEAVAVRHALLALINAMTCVAEDEAYIITDCSEDVRGGSSGLKRIRGGKGFGQGQRRKRQKVVITLDDLRREYQQVLDRCSRIERGDFEFGAGSDEEDDEEDEHDRTWEGSMLKVDKNVKGVLNLNKADRMEVS